tara:strand:- start:6202 stop:6444 length:243 start_codon:yes stop_codon:yes gene_type:complete
MLKNTTKGNEMNETLETAKELGNDYLIKGLQEILILMNADLYSLNGELEVEMIENGITKLDDTQRNEVLQMVMALLKERK